MKKSKSRSHPLTRAQRKVRTRALERDLRRGFNKQDYDGCDPDMEEV